MTIDEMNQILIMLDAERKNLVDFNAADTDFLARMRRHRMCEDLGALDAANVYAMYHSLNFNQERT